jgi:hypothetical protein
MSYDVRTMPEDFGGGEFQDITNINPLATTAVTVLGISMVALPRRWSVLPMLIIACFISSVQKITIATLDFNLLRIMVVFGVARLLIRKEYRGFSWISLDTAIVLWTVSSMIFYVVKDPSFGAVVNRLGFAFDALGMYLLFRCLIREWEDVNRLVVGLILISIPIMFFFLLEKHTGRNLFSFFGGVPEITVIREDRLRCQGAFAHPIIAGCFWAAMMPLFIACWWRSALGKGLAVIGLITTLTIVYCCASSTPVMGVLSALIGAVFFLLRRHMRAVRWSIVLTLFSLHMVMKAPVWHLISRVSAVGGSTSYFRYMLIDSAIRRFHEWALVGTRSTAHWFWGAQDLCNQYVFEGVMGGFLTLSCFIAVIAIAFRQVGRLWRLQGNHTYQVALSWALGVSLFVHCMNFVGVSYFGQIWILWYLLLAIIGSLSIKYTSLKPANKRNLQGKQKSKYYRR